MLFKRSHVGVFYKVMIHWMETRKQYHQWWEVMSRNVGRKRLGRLPILANKSTKHEEVQVLHRPFQIAHRYD